jgi:hypothetical protein
MSTQLFIDNSGSTSGSETYWDQVSTIYQEHPNAEVFFWNGTCNGKTETNKAKEVIRYRTGDGWTLPANFVKYINPKAEKVVVITDGQIDSGDVEKCDSALETHFKSGSPAKIGTYIIAHNPNLSVVAPFIRYGEYEVWVNGDRTSSGDSKLQHDLTSYTIAEDYLRDADKIYGTIAAQNLGRDNPELRKKILEMQTRLMADVNGRAQDDINAKWNNVRDNLKAGTKIEDTLRNIADEYYLGSSNALSREITHHIDRLLTICNSRGNYSVSLLNTSRAERASNAQPLDTSNLPNPDEDDLKVECNITFEDDVPVLQFADLNEPLLAGLEQKTIDLLTNCPLYVIGIPNLVDKILQAVERPIGLETARNVEVSPYTRRKIGATIPLSDNHDLIKAGSHSFIKWLTGGKMLGNAHIWMVAIWHIVKDKDFLSDIAKALEQHIITRMTKYKTYLGLSGLVNSPLIHAPIDISFVYVLMSGFIYPNDDQTERDRLRTFIGPVSSALFDACQLSGFELPYRRIDKRISQLRLVSYLIRNIDNLDELRRQVQAQQQRYLQIGDKVVLLDGPREKIYFNEDDQDAYPLKFGDDLTPSEIMAYIKIIKRNVSYGQHPVPDLKGVDINILNHYNEEENVYKTSETRICPKTLRPFSFVDGMHWSKLSEDKYGPLSGQLSLMNYYIMYVDAHNAYPDVDSLLLFIAEKERNSAISPRETLPRSVYNSAKYTIEKYEAVYETLRQSGIDVTVSFVISRMKHSMDKKKRILMEAGEV